MADGDTVKMRTTFWREQQPPGTIIEVPADEVHRWKGFAEPVEDAAPAPKTDGAPAESASTAEWRAYALSLGMDKTKADKATKSELQDYVAKTTAGATA